MARMRTDEAKRPFTIRAAHPGDAEAIGRIMAELVEFDEYTLLARDEVEKDTRRRAEELARAENFKDRWHIAVVEQDGAVVGMLDLRAVPLKRCGHVMELGLGLLPDRTDRGIGTGMMRYALSKAGELGCRKVRLFVIASNRRALHVYRKVGFKETGRLRDEVMVQGGFEDLVVMEKAIS